MCLTVLCSGKSTKIKSWLRAIWLTMKGNTLAVQEKILKFQKTVIFLKNTCIIKAIWNIQNKRFQNTNNILKLVGEIF